MIQQEEGRTSLHSTTISKKSKNQKYKKIEIDRRKNINTWIELSVDIMLIYIYKMKNSKTKEKKRISKIKKETTRGLRT